MRTDSWRSRGYLPHWEAGEVAQSITFRLADSLPSVVLERLRDELKQLPDDKSNLHRRIRIEQALDRGHGEAFLANECVASIVEQTLLRFDGDRYALHAWVIMPNHVHVVATPLGRVSLAQIAHSWKSFTANGANRLLGRKGVFWAREYHDRAIRDEVHYANATAYVEMNPVKAKLCARPELWRFSSAWEGR